MRTKICLENETPENIPEIASDEEFDQLDPAASTKLEAEIYENLSSNAQRSIDVMASLENLRETIASWDSIGQNERQLIHIASEMAVAGTSFDAGAFIPATEGVTVSMALEAIDARLQKATGDMGNVFVRMFDAIRNFFNKIAFRLRSSRGRFVYVRKQLDGLKKQGVKVLPSVNTKYRVGMTKDLNGHSYSKISEASADIFEAAKFINTYFSTVVGSARIISSDYGYFNTLKDLLNVKETSTAIFKDISNFIDDLTKTPGFKKTGTGNRTEYFETEAFPGGIKVRLSRPAKSEYDLDDLASLKRIENRFHASNVYGTSVDSEISLENVKLADVYKLVDSVEEVEMSIIRHLEDLSRLFDSMASKIQVIFSSVPYGKFAELAVRELLFSYKMLARSTDVLYETCVASDNVTQRIYTNLYLARDLSRARGWE